MNTKNNFAEMAKINVNEHIEKKNGLSYLSWPWAIDQLMRSDPEANWEFHDPQMFGETMMVSCTVTAFGKPIKMHLPVIDHRNKPIPNPNCFDVNKNMMRCLVKAIACHGLGLYIYAGEDIPEEEKHEADRVKRSKITPSAGTGDALSPTDKQTLIDFAEEVNRSFECHGVQAAIDLLEENQVADLISDQEVLTEAKAFRWSLFSSKCRSALENAKKEAANKKEKAAA